MGYQYAHLDYDEMAITNSDGRLEGGLLAHQGCEVPLYAMAAGRCKPR